MTNARHPLAVILLLLAWALLLLVAQPTVAAHGSDALDLFKSRFGSSSAAANAVHHHGLDDQSQTLFLVTWALSDESNSCRGGYATTSGTAGSYRHRFDWNTVLTGNKDLSANDIGVIRDALFDLPASEIPACLEDVVLLSYWKHNRWTHRVFDRHSPPPGLIAIAATSAIPMCGGTHNAPN